MRSFVVKLFRSMQVRQFYVIAMMMALSGWQQPVLAASPGNGGGQTAELRQRIEQLVSQAESLQTCRPLDWAELERFYRQRAYLPAWWDVFIQKRKRIADSMLRLLELSPQHGLAVTDYHLDELAALSASNDINDLALYDVLLTDAFLSYVNHIYSGRTPPAQIDPNWHISPGRLDAVAFLGRVLESEDFIRAVRSLAPPHAGYRRLQKLLSRYRALAAAGGWPQLESGPALREGMRDMRVEPLRKRLWLEGYLADWNQDEFLFDATLTDAVRTFQRLHGIEPDGVVGQSTLAALNVPVTQRIQQVLLNLERWRWLPRDMGERYIMVNMAGFNLQLVEDNQAQLDMRVIIGKPYRSTPAFVGQMTYLVFNPYWNVPERIMREDLLPKQKADPSYLSSHGFRILAGWGADERGIDPADIDWSQVRPAKFPYHLRQEPGPQNSLGRIKFMLPNRFDVYLHDTPARHLFERTVRTFSSGCIRLEEPIALAEALLAANTDEDWSKTAIREVIDTGVTQTVGLVAPIPVYLLYWTAWVDDAGRAHFLHDVYGLDRRMAEWQRTPVN